MVTDEDALLCDLAETYGIYDIESLPVTKIATFSCGLKGDSRIMQALTDKRSDINTMLLASIVDRLSFLAWTKTKDAQSNRNRPESLVNKLYSKAPEREYEVYENGADLLARLEELRG
jgi:hypothetical protein